MHKLGIVVPYRNRYEHLSIFQEAISRYFTRLDIDYCVIVVEQDNGKAFNRGKLCNIGFKEAKRQRCDYVVFHDVDMIPIDVDYSYSDKPVHLISDNLPFKTYFGGLTLFPADLFRKIDGFSNEYWGWGFEDDDLRYRCIREGIPFSHHLKSSYEYNGETTIFNGGNAYALVPNDINYLRDFSIEVDLRLDKLEYDHTKDYDTFPILNIAGYDFSLNYTSFKRFELQFFDNRKKFYQIYTDPIFSAGCRVRIEYNSTLYQVRMYIDDKFIGGVKMDSRLYNYKSNKYIHVGCDWKQDNFFKGAIDRLTIADNEGEYICKYTSNELIGYRWKDLSNNRRHAKLNKTYQDIFNTRDSVDGFVPYRRRSEIHRLPHPDSGFNGGRWESDLTRWNQLKYNNEVLNGSHDHLRDGLSTLKYITHSKKKTKDGRRTVMKVGL